MSDGNVMIDTPEGIENFRRATIRAALRMRVNHGMWPNGISAKLTLPAARSYGWDGLTARQALKFMEELGDA